MNHNGVHGINLWEMKKQFTYILINDNFMARFSPKKYTWNKDHPNYEKPAWLNRNKAQN